jgi:hypothetical protein
MWCGVHCGHRPSGVLAYFRYGASTKTFSVLLPRPVCVVETASLDPRKQSPLTWKQLRRRYLGADRIQAGGVVSTTRRTSTKSIRMEHASAGPATTTWPSSAGQRIPRLPHRDHWRAGCSANRRPVRQAGTGNRHRHGARRLVLDPTRGTRPARRRAVVPVLAEREGNNSVAIASNESYGGDVIETVAGLRVSAQGHPSASDLNVQARSSLGTHPVIPHRTGARVLDSCRTPPHPRR